jgi:hypothetical protein
MSMVSCFNVGCARLWFEAVVSAKLSMHARKAQPRPLYLVEYKCNFNFCNFAHLIENVIYTYCNNLSTLWIRAETRSSIKNVSSTT